MRAALIAALLFAGCVSNDSGDGNTPSIAEESFIRSFETQHLRHLVSSEELPPTDWKILPEIPKNAVIWKDDRFSLSLSLSNRFATQTSGRYRSNSRYHLNRNDGLKLSAAESVLATEDWNVRDEKGNIRIEIDHKRQLLLIVEEKGWSVQRLIVFTLEPRESEPLYLRPRVRESLHPPRNHEIIGIEDGKLYIQQDGKVYAFPIENLETESDLSYSIG
jgi:hypothetical protein